MKKNDVKKIVSVVSDKTQKVNVVHELDLHELSVEEKALVGHLLLEGKELPHPLTHEALSALLTAHEHNDEPMPKAPTEQSEAEKAVNAVFLREAKAAGSNRAERIAALHKWENALEDNLLGEARDLLRQYKEKRTASSGYTDWVSQGNSAALDQAIASDTYCATPAHREAMKITTGSDLQLFLDGDFADAVNNAVLKRATWQSSPTKANWIAFRDSMPTVKSRLRDLRQKLLKDSYVTNDMLESMGQPERPSGQRHPIPPPDYTPEMTITHVPDDNSQLAIVLKTPADKAVIGPNGLFGEVMLALAPPNVSPQDIHPDDDSINWHSFFSTKAKFKVTLPDYLRNKSLLAVARIVNKRGQTGNWGDVHTLQAT